MSFVADEADERFSRYALGTFRLGPVTARTDRLSIKDYNPTNTIGDENSFGLVRHWIDVCEKDHLMCKRPQVDSDPDWKSTRLLFLDDENSRLQLVHGKNLQPRTLYATLSHCWGRMRERLVLRKSNLEEWMKELPSLAKWKTFADAVLITRQLGLSYLWIDSLCIIQDSIEDWQHECPLMSNVYKRSFCNIAATAALNDIIGCFFERDISRDLPLRISVNMNKSEKLYDLCEDSSWTKDVGESILYSRGWVLQERLIAPRVLNFTSMQMFWECDELQASESYPYGFPSEPSTAVNFKAFNPCGLRLQVENGMAADDLLKTAFKIWENAVRAYTRIGNNLTKRSDKLIAISAIARELQPFMNCPYLAGHWEKHLISQLAWRGTKSSLRPDEYIAPSWSWASVDARIQDFEAFDPAEFWHSLIEIQDVQVELATDDPLGQVKSGHLSLKGMLIDLEIRSLGTPVWDMENGTKDSDLILVNGERTYLSVKRDNERSPWKMPCCLHCLPIIFKVPKKPHEKRWNGDGL